jgi:hypothetical protein
MRLEEEGDVFRSVWGTSAGWAVGAAKVVLVASAVWVVKED